jgi:hypothetical protein
MQNDEGVSRQAFELKGRGTRVTETMYSKSKKQREIWRNKEKEKNSVKEEARALGKHEACKVVLKLK